MIQVQAIVHMSKEAGTQIQCNRLEREDATDAERTIADAIESMHVAAMRAIVKAANEGGAEAELTRLLRPDEIDAAKHIAERDAKLEAIKAVVRRWIDSGARRDLDSGGGMLEILAILCPPPLSTGTKSGDNQP